MFTSVTPSLIILKCSCRTMLGLLTKPNACNKISSVDRRHFILRLSVPAMLTEREDLPLRDTRRFAFHQCLVCKSYNKRRHSTHMPARLKNKLNVSLNWPCKLCSQSTCSKTYTLLDQNKKHSLWWQHTRSINNTPTNTIPLLIRWILAAHG